MGALFPRILPWFPRVKQGWPTAAERVNPPRSVLLRARGRRDHCSIGTLPRYSTNEHPYSRTKKPARQAASSFSTHWVVVSSLTRKSSRLARLAEII